jgi:DNA-binding XRE family transcriptional regulator
LPLIRAGKITAFAIEQTSRGGEITYHLEKFGRILLELRKERGWTQSTLAKKMNLSAQSVSKWERGTSYPDIGLFPVLAEIFDVDIDVLFGKDI